MKLLPGHAYHAKSDAELLYIIRDAGAAAVAMRGVSYEAECKYLDQVNDACTILNFRRRGSLDTKSFIAAVQAEAGL